MIFESDIQIAVTKASAQRKFVLAVFGDENETTTSVKTSLERLPQVEEYCVVFYRDINVDTLWKNYVKSATNLPVMVLIDPARPNISFWVANGYTASRLLMDQIDIAVTNHTAP